MHTVVVGGFLITYFESIGAGIALYFRNRILERGEIGHVPGFWFFCCTFLEFKAYGVEAFWCGTCGVIRNDFRNGSVFGRTGFIRRRAHLATFHTETKEKKDNTGLIRTSDVSGRIVSFLVDLGSGVLIKKTKTHMYYSN